MRLFMIFSLFSLVACAGSYSMCPALVNATNSVIQYREALRNDLMHNSYTDTDSYYFDAAWTAHATMGTVLQRLVEAYNSNCPFNAI